MIFCIEKIYDYDGNVEIEEYFIRNKLHREDGPAYIEYSQDGNVINKEYWYKNSQIDNLEETDIFVE